MPMKTTGIQHGASPAPPHTRSPDPLPATMCPVQTSSLMLAATPTAPRWARLHTAETLHRWGLAQLEAAVTQVASELVANAVTAVAGGAVQLHVVRLGLRLLPLRLYVDVFDASPCFPEPREAGEDDESGRGLAIVAALTDDVAVRLEKHGGKTVSAAFGLPQATAASHQLPVT